MGRKRGKGDFSKFPDVIDICFVVEMNTLIIQICFPSRLKWYLGNKYLLMRIYEFFCQTSVAAITLRDFIKRRCSQINHTSVI